MRKLKWGLIGGGEGSQIGLAHRLGAGLDGYFEFSAGALDHRPEAGREYGQALRYRMVPQFRNLTASRYRLHLRYL